MTKEVMISKIYEKIADKTLSFGCRIKNLLFENKRQIWIVREVVTLGMFIKKYVSVYAIPEQCKNDGNQEYIEFENIEIIGHPVMIGDVLDYIVQKYDGEKRYENGEPKAILLVDCWDMLKKPLEMQSDDCIEYIYNLIK